MKSFHTLDAAQTISIVNSSFEGLSSQEALKRWNHYGQNSLPESKPKSIYQTFFEQFKSPIILILIAAVLISFGIGEIQNGWFICAVLIINAAIGTYLERSAAQKAYALRKSVKTFSTVYRNRQLTTLDTSLLTIGDVVILKSGDKISADMRLIESREFMVDESLLTGESVAVLKDATRIFDNEDMPMADRTNMIYSGTYVTTGRARGVITAIGMQTQIGRIAKILAQKGEGAIPLIQRLERFSTNIAIAVLIAGLLLFALAIYHNTPLREVFLLVLALFVSSVPEGLPVAITVALASAAVAMSKRNVIVRKLAAIEGLGSCTMIATDKTGTLTQNRLNVSSVITPELKIDRPKDADRNMALLMIIANEAHLTRSGDQNSLTGDQVDTAFAAFALQADITLVSLFEQERASLLPYESQRKMGGGAIKINNRYLHVFKGSPEAILECCALEADKKKNIQKTVDWWAAEGYRIIAIAYLYAESGDLKQSIQDKNCIWFGFATIIDPLRKGVKEAIKTCHNAGIEVAMVTGDHPATAYHIAGEIGIALSFEEVMDSEAINRWINSGSKAEKIADIRVFARVSPDQKLAIVQAFQKNGHYVAVTGDGVNDAPALKFANIGVAMGRSGTDAAKENADLILSDDAFSSIVNGVEEGRRAYDNIRKVVHLLISTGFAEIVLVLLSMLFIMPVPLLPIQLLWLNLVTNGIQDVALGLETAEPGILKRHPRPPNEPIFNRIMISRIAVGGLYMGFIAFGFFYYLMHTGYTIDSARNLILMLMVLFENAHVFNSRSERISIFKINHLKTLLIPVSVILAQAIHTGALYFPPAQKLLKVKPISFAIFSELLFFALGLIVVMEAEKWFQKRLR